MSTVIQYYTVCISPPPFIRFIRINHLGKPQHRARASQLSLLPEKNPDERTHGKFPTDTNTRSVDAVGDHLLMRASLRLSGAVPAAQFAARFSNEHHAQPTHALPTHAHATKRTRPCFMRS